MGSSLTRDWTSIPCIARWILNHWTTNLKKKKKSAKRGFLLHQAIIENPWMWWELFLMGFLLMQSIWRQKRWNHQETDHGKHKIHKRQLGNWDHGILPLESSSGWIRRAERCLWRGCGDRLSSSRSLVFNPLSQNTFQGMFWCYPGSQRRLCDSRNESVYKTDSILSILLTFFSSANKHSVLQEEQDWCLTNRVIYMDRSLVPTHFLSTFLQFTTDSPHHQAQWETQKKNKPISHVGTVNSRRK